MATTIRSARSGDELVRAIVTTARAALGRSALRRRIDIGAIRAVREAAQQAGLGAELLRWADADLSLTGLARAYVARYVQSYGPVLDLIDVGAHLGTERRIVSIQ